MSARAAEENENEDGEERELVRAYEVWLRRAHVRLLAGRWGLGAMNTGLVRHWRRLGLRPSDRVLDVGCGTGAALGFLLRKVRPTVPWDGTDPTGRFLAMARGSLSGLSGRVRFTAAAAASLPYADEQFEVLLSSHVLHHIPPSRLGEVFAEARRVLRPGGRSHWWAFARAESARQQRQILRRLAGARPPDGVLRNLFFHSEEEVRSELLRARLVPQPLQLGGSLLPRVPRFAITAVREDA